MKCPNCGTHIETAQERWQRRQIARGNCATCGGKRTGADVAYVNCFKCRRNQNERERQRRLRKRRPGLGV